MGRAGTGLWAAHMRHSAALALEPAHRLCQCQELRHSWSNLTRIIVLLQRNQTRFQAPKLHGKSLLHNIRTADW